MVSRFFRNYSWAVVMLGVAYLIDWKTGYEVSVFPLYAFPIAYAAYHGGLAGGLVFAAFGTGCWRLADSISGHTYSEIWIGWEKSFNAFVILAFIAFSFDFFKRRTSAWFSRHVQWQSTSMPKRSSKLRPRASGSSSCF